MGWFLTVIRMNVISTRHEQTLFIVKHTTQCRSIFGCETMPCCAMNVYLKMLLLSDRCTINAVIILYLATPICCNHDYCDAHSSSIHGAGGTILPLLFSSLFLHVCRLWPRSWQTEHVTGDSSWSINSLPHLQRFNRGRLDVLWSTTGGLVLPSYNS